jgi:hypothetical protein
MKYSADDVMPFGINRGFTLKTIYQYRPSYIEWLIKYIRDFEIDPTGFKDLPNPTIPNPNPIISPETKLRLYPSIKIEVSVVKIIDYIKSGNPVEELKFHFSQETLQILEDKNTGIYTPPPYDKSV